MGLSQKSLNKMTKESFVDETEFESRIHRSHVIMNWIELGEIAKKLLNSYSSDINCFPTSFKDMAKTRDFLAHVPSEKINLNKLYEESIRDLPLYEEELKIVAYIY